jgi:hypothetical protein
MIIRFIFHAQQSPITVNNDHNLGQSPFPSSQVVTSNSFYVSIVVLPRREDRKFICVDTMPVSTKGTCKKNGSCYAHDMPEPGSLARSLRVYLLFTFPIQRSLHLTLHSHSTSIIHKILAGWYASAIRFMISRHMKAKRAREKKTEDEKRNFV